MQPKEHVFTIEPRRWYAWQMLPGYVGDGYAPYCSPILVNEVMRLKSGKQLLRLKFGNALYAQGVQDFELDLRVLKRASDYLVAELVYGKKGSNERSAIVSTIDFDWIRLFCPALWGARPLARCTDAAQGSASNYLDEAFNANPA